MLNKRKLTSKKFPGSNMLRSPGFGNLSSGSEPNSLPGVLGRSNSTSAPGGVGVLGPSDTHSVGGGGYSGVLGRSGTPLPGAISPLPNGMDRQDGFKNSSIRDHHHLYRYKRFRNDWLCNAKHFIFFQYVQKISEGSLTNTVKLPDLEN